MYLHKCALFLKCLSVSIVHSSKRTLVQMCKVGSSIGIWKANLAAIQNLWNPEWFSDSYLNPNGRSFSKYNSLRQKVENTHHGFMSVFYFYWSLILKFTNFLDIARKLLYILPTQKDIKPNLSRKKNETYHGFMWVFSATKSMSFSISCSILWPTSFTFSKGPWKVGKKRKV